MCKARASAPAPSAPYDGGGGRGAFVSHMHRDGQDNMCALRLTFIMTAQNVHFTKDFNAGMSWLLGRSGFGSSPPPLPVRQPPARHRELAAGRG